MNTPHAIRARIDELSAQVTHTEDVRAIKRLQYAYGYYTDAGEWRKLADLFTEKGVAYYPNGTFIGRESLYQHFFQNLGYGHEGLDDGRIYSHILMQPVVTVAADGKTAKARWRVLGLLGSFGKSAIWAGNVYENEYVKENGVWKISAVRPYPGYGGAYDGGWTKVREPGSGASIYKLAYPADAPADTSCPGYPTGNCIPPFHYANPGKAAPAKLKIQKKHGALPLDSASRAALELARRIERLEDESKIQNLVHAYGYYVDRALWDQVADLFSDDGSIELGQRGVYIGRAHIRKALDLLGPQGPRDGHLGDHVQLETIVTVGDDGQSATSRSQELILSGDYGGTGTWELGTLENRYVKEAGVWKIKAVHFYTRFITDYGKGWAKDAQTPPGPSKTFKPDAPPTEVYPVYPKFFVPPLDFVDPGLASPAPLPHQAPAAADSTADLSAKLDRLEPALARAADYDLVENLTNAYGYYVDKFLWDDVADLFTKDGSMELAQRGVYQGRAHVRAFLKSAFGNEGLAANRLADHLQLQPVIDIAPDGKSAKIRSRLLQMMGTYGGQGLWGGGIYENEAVKEDGVWRLAKLHAYSTFAVPYEGGWTAKHPSGLPGPSAERAPDLPPSLVYESFPKVFVPPFHYANPVTGR